MGRVVAATDVDFADVVKEAGGPVLVEFWAPWCGPCKQLAPVLEAIAQEHPRLRVVKVDTDESPSTANAYGIRAVPTMLVMEAGEVVKVMTGAKPKSMLIRELADWLQVG